MSGTAAAAFKRITSAMLIGTAAATAIPAQEQVVPMVSASAPIVFFDIAGPDMATQTTFYTTVLGWTIAADGSVAVKAQGPLQGSLQGTLRAEAANDSLLYFGVRDVTATLQKVIESGGTVDVPRFEVPGVVIMGLFRDPAGNRMGLVEVDEDDVAIVP